MHARTFTATLLALLVLSLLAPGAPAHARQAQNTDIAPAADQQVEAPPALPEPDEADGGRHRITDIDFRYTIRNPDHPDQAALLDTIVVLQETEEGFIAPREGYEPTRLRLADLPEMESHWFFDSALALIAPSAVQRLQTLGFIGIYVEPDPQDFAVIDGRVVDRRPADRTELTLLVTTGVVNDVRTVGMGDHLPEDDRINNPAHRRILDRSPVAARDPETGEVREGRTDLLRRDRIDDFVYRLNRHPGRRVDVAVAATGDEFGAVSVDYLVTENRPWFLYAQLANTGTRSTDRLRQRFGFVHNQLTGNDDIFFADYITSNFDELHAVTVSYERPLPDSERWRWRAYGSWNEYTATDVGVVDAEFKGRGWSASAELIANIVQNRDLFIDLVGGARWQQVSVNDRFIGQRGREDFVIPYAGLRLEQLRENRSTRASAFLETNLSGIAGTDSQDIDRLGRFDADNNWVALLYDASHSFYLDPFFRSADEEGSLAHELAFQARGQFAFGNRLAPNFQQVAGGLYTVRGYPEAIAAGDNVFIASAEYRYHIPRALSPDPQPGAFFGRPFRFAPQYQYGPTDWDLFLRGFVDFARTTDNDRLSFEANQTLVSAGVGVELSISRHLSARVDWGFALKDLDDGSGRRRVDAGDNRVHFVITLVY